MSRKSKAEGPGQKNVAPLDSRRSPLDRTYAFVFGLFLGLCIWKFGNPVILDQRIVPPASFDEFLDDPWPTHWADWVLAPLAILGAVIAFRKKLSWRAGKWFWLAPLLWFGWQGVAATRTVDAALTTTTLWQFFGCAAAFLIGLSVIGRGTASRWLLPGILAAFAFCLVRAVDQKVVEFPRNREVLIEGQQANWTNLPPETVGRLRHDGVIINTNGVDVVNPAVLAKFEKGRVMGTLVYPNALAGIILLLGPLSITLAFTKKLRPMLRAMVVGLTLFLGGAGLYWSGSKLGWLIAMVLAGLYLLRLPWPVRWKMSAIAGIFLIGLAVFIVRFHHYFAGGATSVGARFDYWRAAAQITVQNPLFGTGPGTFQHPYAQLKSPGAEMTRLTHNDYLEQFCDSGIPGGLFYGGWVVSILIMVGVKVWKTGAPVSFAIFLGLVGWFGQGFGEFSLYVPALAWTAFMFLGCLAAQMGNEFDNSRQNR